MRVLRKDIIGGRKKSTLNLHITACDVELLVLQPRLLRTTIPPGETSHEKAHHPNGHRNDDDRSEQRLPNMRFTVQLVQSRFLV